MTINDTRSVEWRTIKSFPAYSVSSDGQVRRDAVVHGGGGSIRYPTGVLRQRALPLGHLQVTLSMNNEPRTLLVHRLVAEAFLPQPLPGKDCVCHKDDDPRNNCVNNLFWGDRTDNSNDKVEKNRQAKGELVGTAKITAKDVKEIHRLYRSGLKQRDIAAMFGISKSNVSMITSFKTWRHISGD